MAGKKRGGSGNMRLILGGLLTVLVCLLLLALAAKLVQTGKLPETAAQTAATGCCLLSSLIGAAVALHRQRSRWRAAALLTGSLAAVFLLAAALCSAGEGGLRISPAGLACMLGPVPAVAVLGAGKKVRRRR